MDPRAATPDDVDLWERHAHWWVDGFTDGADPEYVEQILPLALHHLDGATRILDLGCGDGQIARLVIADAARHGRPSPTVIGVDPTAAQLAVAATRGGGPAWARAGAAAIPLADASVDAVIACLVFEHITEMDAAVAEVARVLQPEGRFVLMLNHPILQSPGSGWIIDHVLDERYWRMGAYLTEQVVVEEVQKDVFLPFVHRPISRYLNALAVNGLMLDRVDEPAPPAGYIDSAPELGEQAAIPRLLVLRSRRHR